MLSIGAYDATYVTFCRSHVDRQMKAFRAMQEACPSGQALQTLEHSTFLNMVLALDALFGHRARGQELKDGNALNEVRMICGSVLQGSDRLLADKTIRYDPAAAVLGLEIGDRLVITAEAFERLAGRFLDEILAKYSPSTRG